MTVSEVARRAGRYWVRARHRYAWFDHAVRAIERFQEVNATQLAAAAAYYAFFAVFALGLLGFAVLSRTLQGNQEVQRAVEDYVKQNLPRLDVDSLIGASTQVGLIAVAGLLVTGLAWVNSLRVSVRTVWGLEENPGNFVVRRLIDVVVLIGLGLLLTLSVAIVFGVSAALRWLVDAAGESSSRGSWLLNGAGVLLGMAVNTVLAIAILTVLPRLRMRFGRVFPAALLISIGLELLKGIGRLYFEHTEANPAYQAVAGAVGLLLFMYLFHNVILFAAALTATSECGVVTEHSARTDETAAGPGAATPPRRTG